MRNWKSPLFTALTFALVGPPSGTLAFAVWGMTLDGERIDPLGGLIAALWMLSFGYLMGIVPAALTGLAAGLIFGRLRGLLFVAASAVAGFAVTWGFATFSGSGPDMDGGSINLALIGAVAGAASGAISAVLSKRRKRRVAEQPHEAIDQ